MSPCGAHENLCLLQVAEPDAVLLCVMLHPCVLSLCIQALVRVNIIFREVHFTTVVDVS